MLLNGHRLVSLASLALIYRLHHYIETVMTSPSCTAALMGVVG